MCSSINPHIAPTLDAFRLAPQPAGGGRATDRSADGGAQRPQLSTYAPRQMGSTPLGGRGEHSVSGISSFAFQVTTRLLSSTSGSDWMLCHMWMACSGCLLGCESAASAD
jgi:hypothetical protein